jgi:hypothetical protein
MNTTQILFLHSTFLRLKDMDTKKCSPLFFTPLSRTQVYNPQTINHGVPNHLTYGCTGNKILDAKVAFYKKRSKLWINGR